MKILFFSRGRGHGHAIPDMVIAEKIQEKDASAKVRFASYATGASTFVGAGRQVLDLNLPENNAFVKTILTCLHAIEQEQPELVVSHEEFAALPAAHALGIRSVFISAWLPQTPGVSSESLEYANAIFVIDNPGVFAVPATARVRPVFTGPIVRKMQHTCSDRLALRKMLGIAHDCFCIAVVPGGSEMEDSSLFADLVLSAFLLLKKPAKRIIWMAKKGSEKIEARLSGIRDVTVTSFQHPIERILAACDLVLTRGTRGITYDAYAIGIPSLSLSPGTNPVDDLLVPRIRNNLPLIRKAVDPVMLAEEIVKFHAKRQIDCLEPLPESDAASQVAQGIVNLMKLDSLR